MLFSGLPTEEWAGQLRATLDIISKIPAQPDLLQGYGIVAGQKDKNVLLHNELLKGMADTEVGEYEAGNFAGQASPLQIMLLCKELSLAYCTDDLCHLKNLLCAKQVVTCSV